jgi:hypothetical protein
MDIVPSDSRIHYDPLQAWTDYTPRKRAPSCLEGTKRSSTSGSSFSLDFTGEIELWVEYEPVILMVSLGSSVQLYSVSESIGTRYSIAIDGESVGTYNVSATEATRSGECIPVSLYTTASLTDSQHTVKLTVEGSSNTNQTEFIFAGIR